MVGDVKVVMDGVDRDRPKRRPNPPWIWVMAGLVVGFGFGALLSTPVTTTPVPVDDRTPQEPVSAVEEIPDPVGIADAVPGFPDALVAVSESEGSTLEYLLWPVAGDPIARALPAGDFGTAAFDSSGTWLAISTQVPDTAGMVLSVGRSFFVQPLASGVTSFKWHDGNTPSLAYTQVVDDEWLLWEVGPDLNSEIKARGLDPAGKVAAWGDWGWAIQNPENNQIILLTPDGELKTTVDGVVFDSYPAGWMVISGETGLRWLSSGGGLQSLSGRIESIGSILAMAISPDGESVAILGTGGMKVSPLDGEGPVFHAPFTTGNPVLAWSSDSRFVILPWVRGVMVFDVVEGGRSFQDLTRYTVKAVSVIRVDS